MNNSHADFREFLPTLDLTKKSTANNSSAIKISFEEKKTLPSYFETKEWQEILRIVNLTQEEVNRLIKNKVVSKLINAFEILSKLLNEKNIQIKNLEKEIDGLNTANRDMTNENFKLMKNLSQLVQESTDLKVNYQNYISAKENGNPNIIPHNLDESMVGNSSKLTMQYLNTTINNDDFKSGYQYIIVG